jgi:hypothetical protein
VHTGIEGWETNFGRGSFFDADSNGMHLLVQDMGGATEHLSLSPDIERELLPAGRGI